ncbi:MAG: glutathione peroxidase [Acidobacteria bacterium]|nr:glutathione peroxidase [Acidobacteriota bacterium]
MRYAFLISLLLGGTSMTMAQEAKTLIYQFKVTTIDGQKIDLAKYKGKVLLIVNVASECGYTKQYKELQALHAKYAKDGLAILAFPCNDFGQQEPGDDAKVKDFAKKEYGVQFDLFSKIKILGKDGAPLYQFLTSKKTNPNHAGDVKWNFEKFIIGRDGTIIARFQSDTEPDAADLMDVLRRELAKK